MDVDPYLLVREEAKRLRCTSPEEPWRLILQTITWAEAQAEVPRNSRESALARQAKLLATMMP